MNIKCWFGFHNYVEVWRGKILSNSVMIERKCTRCCNKRMVLNSLDVIHYHPICGHVEGSDTCWYCMWI